MFIDCCLLIIKQGLLLIENLTAKNENIKKDHVNKSKYVVIKHSQGFSKKRFKTTDLKLLREKLTNNIKVTTLICFCRM